MAYHPTNMTISLLPVISEDGRELRWDHQAASTSYVMGVDQVRWGEPRLPAPPRQPLVLPHFPRLPGSVDVVSHMGR